MHCTLVRCSTIFTQKTWTMWSEIQIQPIYHLVVRFSEVVQAGDVFQEQAKFCRQMFEHQAMVVSLLQLPHMLLGLSKRTHISVTFYHLHQPGQGCFISRKGVITYFVLDLPPRQLTDQKLHQHVEERPQVIMTTHFLHNYKGVHNIHKSWQRR